MSSISSTTTQIASTPRPAHAHKNRVASEIDSEASNGTISATDATALTSALDSIDASLQSGGTSAASSGTAAARLDPSAMKDKIDGLIADQVSSGSLTSDQAATLTSLFAKGSGGAGGTHEGGAVGGAGGPPPGPPPGGQADGDASGTASDTSGTTSTSDLLASFIKQLQATQASATGYAASGSTANRSNASALVLDYRS